MTTNSKTMEVRGQEGVVADVERIGHAHDTKEKGLFRRMKDLVGKVLIVDEDWIFKSKDWPYLWDHKDTDDKA